MAAESTALTEQRHRLDTSDRVSGRFSTSIRSDGGVRAVQTAAPSGVTGVRVRPDGPVCSEHTCRSPGQSGQRAAHPSRRRRPVFAPGQQGRAPAAVRSEEARCRHRRRLIRTDRCRQLQSRVQTDTGLTERQASARWPPVGPLLSGFRPDAYPHSAAVLPCSCS